MKHSRTAASARALATAALVIATGMLLAACQASPGDPQQVEGGAPVPSLSQGTGPGGETSRQPLPSPSSSAIPPPAPSREAQAQLDQDLIAAAKANNAPLVAQLISRGGDVNAKDSIQDSAFLFAGAEGFNEVLQLTLAAGADVAATNRYGGTALIPASEHGHVETVRMLIAAGVPINHVNNLGWTAMQEAVLLNNGGPRQQEVVRLLLAAGADPAIRDPAGRTALQNAERLGFKELAALIRGAA
ncbi:ankyrin repeat domain-containing protein [Pseudarthrobacter sp. alpha12b]